jgi:pimeloyl-ACP methyl ester carboxylesterase
MIPLRRLAPLAAALLLVACGQHDVPSAPRVERQFGALHFKPCTLRAPMAPDGVEAWCTTLPVAENPAQPDGRTLALDIAWVPSDDDQADPDPVFLLAGGPGQSASTSYPAVAPAFGDVLRHRHVILVDQRGTGKSNPLQCPGADAIGDDLQAGVRFVTACRDRLAKSADLRFYTTTDAVRDLDAVRAALGVAKIDLLGISYGTRVAQQYAGTHPEHVRAMVLDSVAPNTLVFGSEFAANLDRALALDFGLCERDPACVKALGSPAANLKALRKRIATAPPEVAFRDAADYSPQHATLDDATLAGVLRLYAYSPLTAALLPLTLHDAAAGHLRPLMAQAAALGKSLDGDMAYGMQLSVVCAEDAPALRVDPADAGRLLGTGLTESLLAQCAVWPQGAVPAGFHTPLASVVPTLVLEGEFDPVTPPRYGEEVVKSLPHARLLVLKGQGHNVIGAGCMPKLFARFLDTPDPKALDAGCLDALAPTPPFLSYNGWAP